MQEVQAAAETLKVLKELGVPGPAIKVARWWALIAVFIGIYEYISTTKTGKKLAADWQQMRGLLLEPFRRFPRITFGLRFAGTVYEFFMGIFFLPMLGLFFCLGHYYNSATMNVWQEISALSAVLCCIAMSLVLIGQGLSDKDWLNNAVAAR